MIKVQKSVPKIIPITITLSVIGISDYKMDCLSYPIQPGLDNMKVTV